MDDLLQIIAEQKGYPTDMVERSAAARAKADGVSTEDVLRSWAGVGGAAEPAAVGAAPAAAPAAAETQAAETQAAETQAAETQGTETEATEPAALEETGPKVEVLVPDPAPADADESKGGVEEPEREPASFAAGIPRWLAAAFVVLPALALLYVLVLPSGPECGSAGALAVDPATGVAENCDGSPYGADGSDVFAIGDSLYTAQCAACHGAGGGGGTGPAFTNGAVLATFSSCSNHVEWVVLGTAGWPDATYGDTAKPVGGGGQMPGFGATLTAEDIAAVVLYERVAFGGEDRAAAETACFGDGAVTAATP